MYSIFTIFLTHSFNYCSTFKEAREPREPRNKRFEKKSEESKPSSGKISLFDFLEDKLPLQSETAETNNPSQNSYTQNTESNHERIEFKNNEIQSGKGGRYAFAIVGFFE